MRHYEDQLAELEALIAESENYSSIKDAERQKKQLLNELSKMFRTVADVILADDLVEVERPPIKGGHPEQVNILRSPIISRFMDYLCDEYEWYEGNPDKRELSHIPLLIYGMSRKVTIAPRLIDYR